FDDGEHGFEKFQPDISITSSPYSFNAKTLQGFEPEDFLQQSSRIESSQIADDAVGTSQIADSSITPSKISIVSDSGQTLTLGDPTHQNVKLAAGVAGPNQPAIRYNSGVNEWQISNDGITYEAIS